MASLTSQTVAASYGKLLITDSNSGLSGTASNIEDGDGTSSPLYLSTARVGIGQSSPAVELDITGSLNITGTADIAGTTQIGGGYGSTGIDLTDAGVIQANGALTIDGASTLCGAITASSTAAIAGNTTIGGGYGSTGVTLSSAGVVQMNGALTVDGASTLTGAVTASSTMAVAGALTIGGNIDFNSGTIDLSTQTVDVTLNAAVDALNFDSNTLSIDASNNRVGIGTASPLDELHLESTGAVGGKLGFYLDDNASGTITTTDILGIIKFGGSENGSAFGEGATMRAMPSEAWDIGDDDLGTELQFLVCPNQSATPTKRMTIANDGNVAIGNHTPTESLHISGAGERGILVTSTDNDSVLELASDTDQGQNSKLIFSSGSSDSKATILYDHHDTPATQKMQFLVGDNAVTAATILGDGKVGIGTAPDESLHVKGGTPKFKIEATTSAAIAAIDIVAHSSAINKELGPIQWMTGGVSNAAIVPVIGAAANISALTFYTSDAGSQDERMRIDRDGKVGIGTAAPSTLLHLLGVDPTFTICRNETDANVDTDEVIGKIQFLALDASATTEGVGFMQVVADGNHSATDNDKPGRMEFYTESAGGGTALATPRMVIKADGNVGIGDPAPDYDLHVKTADDIVAKFESTDDVAMILIEDTDEQYFLGVSGTTGFFGIANSLSSNNLQITAAGNVGIGVSDPGGKLEVKYTSSGTDAAILIEDTTNRDDNPFLQYVNSDGHMGGLKNSGSGADVSTYDTSDVRIKTNIEDAPPMLDKINQIKIRHYNLKTKSDSVPALGVIAQEINNIFPEKVGKSDDGTGEELPEGTEPWNVSYSWSYELIKAVQELSAKVTALENA